MVRNVMKNGRQKQAGMQFGCSGTGSGQVRAGMHRGAVQAYRRGLQAEKAGETPAVVTLPPQIEAEIPPVEESDDVVVAEIADGSIRVETVGEAVAAENDPEPVPAAESAQLMDGMPLLEPVTGGVNCEPCVIVYDPGDGVPRAIPDPLGILGEVHFE